MIDFASDVGDLFADVFAEDATYYPCNGGSLAVRVMRSSPDEIGRFGEMRFSSETTVFRLPVASISEPRADDLIGVGSHLFRVQGVPQRDLQRLVWVLDTRPQDAD